MCNAAKHSPGCSCGFGPPYPASYSAVNTTEWSREVLQRPDLVTRGLRDSAWDAKSIEEFVEKYLEIKNSELPADTMVSRIRELLGMRRKVVESITEDWINVPLYRFGAPDVTDAKVEYSEGEGVADGSGWSLRVFGVGTGATTTVQVNKARTFVAEAGTWKQVYVPVKLVVSRIAVYEGDRLIGRGVDAQVAPPRDDGDQFLRRRAVKSVPRLALGDRPDDFDDVLECDLIADDTGAVHRDKRSWETDVAQEVGVRLSKVANISALVSVKRTRRLGLEFALPAGHDYLAYLCPGTLWWERPS